MVLDVRDFDHRHRLLALLVLAPLPWVVVVSSGATSLVFPFGLVNLDPLHVTLLSDYLFRYTQGLPRFLLAWPIAVVLYAGALASATLAFVDREDVRVTAGLLALSAFSQGWTAVGFNRRLAAVALPVGAAIAALVLWVAYAPALVRE